MENIRYITDSFGDQHVIIDIAENEFISMPKAIYDEQLAAQSANEL